MKTTKKLLSLLLVFVIMCTSLVGYSSVLAETQADDNNETQINTTDIFGSNPIEEVNINLLNKELYDESLAEYDFTGAVAMQVYLRIYWKESYKSLEELRNIGDSESKKDYIIFLNDTLVRVREEKTGDEVCIRLIDEYAKIPHCWQDYIAITSNDSNKIKSVTVFGADQPAFYYVYEDETKVLYYEYCETSAEEYSLENFQQFAPDYYAYKMSRSYGPNGELLYGGTISFASFLERYDYYMSQIGSYERNAQQRAKITYITIAAASFVLISGGIITVLLIRKKRGIK